MKAIFGGVSEIKIELKQVIFCKSRVIFLPCKSDIVRFAHSDILFAKSNLSLGEAKYNYEVISLSLLNRTCVANRTKEALTEFG